jgi:hypothetical protein
MPVGLPVRHTAPLAYSTGSAFASTGVLLVELPAYELRRSIRTAAQPRAGENEVTIWSMALAETQQLRMLEGLRSAGSSH